MLLQTARHLCYSKVLQAGTCHDNTDSRTQAAAVHLNGQVQDGKWAKGQQVRQLHFWKSFAMLTSPFEQSLLYEHATTADRTVSSRC